jgi:hypothetical protein
MPEKPASNSPPISSRVRWFDWWNTALSVLLAVGAVATGAWTFFCSIQNEITTPLVGHTFKHVDRPDASCNVAGRTIIQYEVVNPGPGSLDVTALQINLFEPCDPKELKLPDGFFYEPVRACTCSHKPIGDGSVIEVTPVVTGVRRLLAKGNSFGVKISVPHGQWDIESANVVLADGREFPLSGEMPAYPGLTSTWRTQLILPIALLTSFVVSLIVTVLASVFAAWSSKRHEAKIRENERLLMQEEYRKTIPAEDDQNTDIITTVRSGGQAGGPVNPNAS